MKKLFFIYDSLMTKNIQNILRLPIQFISYGYVSGNLYFLNDGKKRRHFFIKGFRKCVYGGIFLIEDYEEFKGSLHSFYNSSKTYTGKTLPIDLYVEDTVTVTPIIFNNLKEFERSMTSKGEPIECNVFCGNITNTIVNKSISKSSYYKKTNGIDAVNFLQLIKEEQDGKERNNSIL